MVASLPRLSLRASRSRSSNRSGIIEPYQTQNPGLIILGFNSPKRACVKWNKKETTSYFSYNSEYWILDSEFFFTPLLVEDPADFWGCGIVHLIEPIENDTACVVKADPLYFQQGLFHFQSALKSPECSIRADGPVAGDYNGKRICS